jgi:RNA-directed DNA polymerase
VDSPVLANWALDGLQRELDGICRTRRAATAAKVNFVRYADDFIITASSKEFLENEVKPRVRSFLAKRGLKLSDEKTVITHVQTGFDFLGWTVRWRGGMLLTQPSKKNVKRWHGCDQQSPIAASELSSSAPRQRVAGSLVAL